MSHDDVQELIFQRFTSPVWATVPFGNTVLAVAQTNHRDLSQVLSEMNLQAKNQFEQGSKSPHG